MGTKTGFRNQARNVTLNAPHTHLVLRFPAGNADRENWVVTRSVSMIDKNNPVAQKYSYSWYRDRKFLPGGSCDKRCLHDIFPTDTAGFMGSCLSRPSIQAAGITIKLSFVKSVLGQWEQYIVWAR